MTLVGAQPAWLDVVEKHNEREFSRQDATAHDEPVRSHANGSASNGAPKREKGQAAEKPETGREGKGANRSSQARDRPENGAHDGSSSSDRKARTDERCSSTCGTSPESPGDCACERREADADAGQQKYLLVQKTEQAAEKPVAKVAERSAVDTVYEFLATDVNYVLLGDLQSSAGHPSFQPQPRPKPPPKPKCAPEERMLIHNLLRTLDLRELDTPEVEARLVRTIRLLAACGYHWDDIVTVMTHAAIYFPTIRSSVVSQTTGWDHEEVINVLIVLIYLAHAFALDETCPISHWHRWIFRNYCSLPTLNMVVIRVLQLQKFHLCITRKEWKGVSRELTNGRGEKRLGSGKKEDAPGP